MSYWAEIEQGKGRSSGHEKPRPILLFYDLNSEILVHYSIHVLNNKLLLRYSSQDLNNEPFNQQTILDHLNTKIVCYSDPYCIAFLWDYGYQKK